MRERTWDKVSTFPLWVGKQTIYKVYIGVQSSKLHTDSQSCTQLVQWGVANAGVTGRQVHGAFIDSSGLGAEWNYADGDDRENMRKSCRKCGKMRTLCGNNVIFAAKRFGKYSNQEGEIKRMKWPPLFIFGIKNKKKCICF